MGKLKKIIAGAIFCAAIGCAAAVGCAGSPNYYKLTMESKGFDFVYSGALRPDGAETFISGGEVKEGVEVCFSIDLTSAEGTPVVYLVNTNGDKTLLTPSTEGVYSFTMSEECSVSVEGLIQKKTVTLAKSSDLRIEYLDESGEEYADNDDADDSYAAEIKVSEGDSVKFKLWISPYYTQSGLSVTANTEVLEKGDDGYYTISDITEDYTVNVSGLTEETSFAERDDGGSGTEDDPFLLTRPIDLYQAAAIINSSYYNGEFNACYFKLGADIDLDGEQLFVFGDSESTVFCGTFDGAGYTIKNFTITDEYIDQEEYTTQYLNAIGMFGYVSATSSAPAVIKNLTLENYTIEAHPNLYTESVGAYVGSIVGYGIGVEISNCHLKGGEITSYGNHSNMAYVGGVAGILQSAYSTSSATPITYDAYVYGCSSDVDIYCVSDARSAGGIVGNLVSADDDVIAYISDCASYGTVYGAMHSGGVVGSLGRFSSVNNCYSAGAITSYNNINSNSVDVLYRVSYAGGIAGFAENDTIIYGCYSANSVISALSSNSNYPCLTGDFVGYSDEAASEAINSAAVLVVGNYKTSDGTAVSLKDSLGWADTDWDFTGSVPALNYSDAAKTYTLQIKCGGENVASATATGNNPTPICGWYENNYIAQYLSGDSGRTYGYYFDEGLTKKVPAGFIPTGSKTLYVGYADYSSVMGTYYFGETEYGVDAYFTLSADGTYSFRDGGMSSSGYYSYDGATVTLYSTCFGTLEYDDDTLNGEKVAVYLETVDGGYQVHGSVLLTETTTDSTGTSSYTYTLTEFTLPVVKTVEGFGYGKYTGAEGTVYSFSKDGTGYYISNGSSYEHEFTYTIADKEGGGYTLTLSNRRTGSYVKGSLIVNGESCTANDGLCGEWKTSANSLITYTFDGMGGVTCGGGASVSKYTFENGQGYIDNSIELKLTSDNTLMIDGVEYFINDGYTGIWYGSYTRENDENGWGEVTENYELTLGGIGLNGYGEATIYFSSSSSASYSGQYSVEDGVMRLYVGETQYASLELDTEDGTASGTMYSLFLTSSASYATTYYVGVEMSLYDIYKGVWITDIAGISSINFTGKGTALITKSAGGVSVCTYTVDEANTAKLTYNSVEYTLTLDEAKGIATAVSTSAENSLAARDSWYGITLYDAEGNAYSFDGKGYIGGTVTATGTESLTYSYSCAADGSLKINNTAVTEQNGAYKWGATTLSIKSGFAGAWKLTVSNTELTIEEVRLSGGVMVAKVGDVDYTYNASAKTLSYTQTLANGTTLTTTLSLLGDNELGESVSSGEYRYYLNSTKLDSYAGKTYTDSATGASWTFDGHSAGTYKKGVATYKDGNTETNYNYSINSLGYVAVTKSDGTYVFTESADGNFAGDSKTYAMNAVDDLYLTVVADGAVNYTLDGLGGVWTSDSGAYTKQSVTYVCLTDELVIWKADETTLRAVVKSGKLVEFGSSYVYTEYTVTNGETSATYVLDGTGGTSNDEAGNVYCVKENGVEVTPYVAYRYTTSSGANEGIKFYLAKAEESEFNYIMTVTGSGTATITEKEAN